MSKSGTLNVVPEGSSSNFFVRTTGIAVVGACAFNKIGAVTDKARPLVTPTSIDELVDEAVSVVNKIGVVADKTRPVGLDDEPSALIFALPHY